MATDTTEAARKGPYAKGVAKREEILRTALVVIAHNGYGRTSVRELADAVGLSQAGLLHYFTSKEELFAEILRERDQVDRRAYGTDAAHVVETLVQVMRHNAEVPGLVQLYARLSSEATDPEHPAHDYFAARYANLRAEIADGIRAQQEAGDLVRHVDPEKLATVMLAVSDGLQTQWMLDPGLDMAEHIDLLWSLISGSGRR